MPPLQSIFPVLPGSLAEIMITVAGLMGAITLSYAVLLETEKRQDAVFVLAGFSLFVYALLVSDRVLIFAGGLLFIVAGGKLINILRGKHHHTWSEIEKYEHPGKK